jgi:hypothetical protein
VGTGDRQNETRNWQDKVTVAFVKVVWWSRAEE